MSKEMPFDEDIMTLIMGIGGPDKPGQHGRTATPAPEKNTIDLITQIRDLCDEFLNKGAKENQDKPEQAEEKPSDAQPAEVE